MFNNRRKSEIAAWTFFFSFLEVKLTNKIIRYLKWMFRWFDIQVPCENSTDKFHSSFLGVAGWWVFIFLRYLPLCLCGWTFMIFCSSKFRLYSTVSSAIVTISYIRSSDFIHLTTESLYPLTFSITHTFSTQQVPIYSLLVWVWLLKSPHTSDIM